MAWSLIPASTSESQACGSTSLSRAVWINVYMTAARSPPLSEPANSHDFLPRATLRSARPAALLVRQMLPSSRKRAKAAQRLSIESIALATSEWRESFALSARIHPSSAATSGAARSRRAASRSSADRPLISRSMSKIASIRFTASKAKGAATKGEPRALATPASTKNLRRPCAQQAASTILPGARPGSYSRLKPE